MNTIGVLLYGDNYIYVVHDATHATVIDPCSAQPVLGFLLDNNLTLSAVLITHHHGDHTGGISQLYRATGCAVYGTKASGSGVSKPVKDGDIISLQGTAIEVIAVPGHTKDHVAYYIPENRALFTGDTLFVAGCGRLFGGTATEMWDSLQKLAALPDDTLVYCGHEYTEENLRFATMVDPDNKAVFKKTKDIHAKLIQGTFTVPSTIAEEKETNPFVRAQDAKAFAILRKRKDVF